MLEARLQQAAVLKKLLDAIKELVSDCNLDCNDSGIALQAMDNSHVALVSMLLRAEGFDPYRCDRNVALGLNLNSFAKVLRSAQNDDIITIKAEDTPDTLNLVFESAKAERTSEYDVKLMDIDSEHMGIPDTDYDASVTLPATEFQRICRDLVGLSESVTIDVSKGSIKFSCQGDIGNGQITLKSYDDPETPSNNVNIELSQGVSLSFSLKYLVNFTKATPLSGSVTLRLLESMPILVEYNMEGVGHLHFYLAPKSTEED